MKKMVLLSMILLMGLTSWPVSVSHAGWTWTPETGWISSRRAVRPSPEERFAWAEELFQNGEYAKAIREHRRLVRNYPDSLYAPRSQYALGSIYEALGKYYRAALEYQKVIDNFPASDKIAEVVESQHRLGNLLFDRKIEGRFRRAFLESNYEKAARVYQLVVKNAPFGERAAEAQYKIGLSRRQQGNFLEATSAYRKVIRNYPQSPWVENAYYGIGLSYFSQSLPLPYDQGMTNSALKQFQEFQERFPDSELLSRVEEKIKLLRGRQAESLYRVARFYERRGSIRAAIIYHRKVREKYSESDWAALSRERLSELEEKTD